MRHYVWLSVACLALLPNRAVAAEQHIGPHGAPWCEKLPSLMPYIEGVIAHDTAALEPLQDCVWLKSGVRVEVLKDYIDFGAGWHVVQVRVFGNGTSVDGHSTSNGLEAAP